MLQPRGEEYKEYSKWEPVHDDIREILRTAVNKLKFLENQCIKYDTSATHQEILNGALKTPDEIEDANKHVFAFVRKAKIEPKDKSASGFLIAGTSI